MTRISRGAKKIEPKSYTALVRLYFCSVQSPFQDEDFHGLPERLKSPDQMVVLPREKVLPGTGNLFKGLSRSHQGDRDISIGGFLLPIQWVSV
jgi:hypothetical protein